MPSMLAFALSALLVSATATDILFTDDVLNVPYSTLMSTPSLDRRQADDGAAGNETLLNSDGSLNMTSWFSVTDTICRTTLAALVPGPSSPSGFSICFNMPSLDARNGIFEADLRLYRVAPPRGDFVDIDPAKVDVGVTFSGAEVDRVKSESEVLGAGVVGEVGSITKRQAKGKDEPELMQAYLLVGRITPDKMERNLSLSALEAFLLPTLTLTAPSPNSQTPLKATLSPNEASFLTGVFSDQLILSEVAKARAAVDVQVAALASGDIAFVMPGTQMMVFPIGLIITLVWLVLGAGAYGWGTYERMQFKGSYEERRRIVHGKEQQASGTAHAPYAKMKI